MTSRSTLRSVVGWIAALTLSAAVTGCGVQPQSQPAPLPGHHRLVGSAASPDPTTTFDAGSTVIFLVRGNRLAEVWRPATTTNGPGDLMAVLLRPVSRDEAAHGFRTAIPPTTHHLSVDFVSGVAMVPVPDSFNHLRSTERVLAVAQLVYTLSEEPGVRGLQLTDGVKAIDTPTGSGALVARPVTRSDFVQVVEGAP